jgi:hypothetical protein
VEHRLNRFQNLDQALGGQLTASPTALDERRQTRLGHGTSFWAMTMQDGARLVTSV